MICSGWVFSCVNCGVRVELIGFWMGLAGFGWFVLSRVFWIWLVCDLILLLVVANKFGGFGCFGFGFGGFDGFCGFVLKCGVWVGICQDFSCFWYFELIFLGWGGFLGFNGLVFCS